MKLVVIANVEMQKEFESKSIPEGIVIHFETDVHNAISNADAYFWLLNESFLQNDMDVLKGFGKPVFVNAVATCLSDLPEKFIRLNAWRGFLQRSIVECAVANHNKEEAEKIFKQLGWHYQLIPDIPGLITARVIAMIINEAYFALGDNVSTKEDIDIAMKLGTNYPHGPFEWSEIIGLENIYHLLVNLSETDMRYAPAERLVKEISL